MLDQRARNIWTGLVAFANADLNSDKSLGGWAETVLESMPQAARSFTIEEWQEELDSFLYPDKKLKELPAELQNEKQNYRQKFINEVKEYQPKIHTLLSYLCHQPEFDIDKNEEVRQACDFLWRHETHVSFAKMPEQEGDRVPTDFELSRRRLKRISKRKRLYPYRNVPRYQDMVDPICKFIADQLEAYYDGSTEHLVPIIICRREGCGKFIMPKRVGRKSLCDDCKDRHFNEVRKPLQTDRRWLYRLIKIGEKSKGGNRGALVKTLKDPKIKERFSRAKKRLPKLAAKVDALAS